MRLTKLQLETQKKQANLKVQIHSLIEKSDLSTLEIIQCLNQLEATILKYVLRQDTE